MHPANPRHVAILPGSWKIQHYTPLWLGIRTGFCGSLSTFASWNLQMVEMICDYQRSWEAGDAAFGYIIGQRALHPLCTPLQPVREDGPPGHVLDAHHWVCSQPDFAWCRHGSGGGHGLLWHSCSGSNLLVTPPLSPSPSSARQNTGGNSGRGLLSNEKDSSVSTRQLYALREVSTER